jgi:hypothetical protein
MLIAFDFSVAAQDQGKPGVFACLSQKTPGFA